MIEFDLSGTLVHANQNFLSALGYTLAEIVGKHHSMFVRCEDHGSDAYRRCWEKLARGEYDDGQYLRLGKDGREVSARAGRGRPMSASPAQSMVQRTVGGWDDF